MNKLIELKAYKITFCLWKLGVFGLLEIVFVPFLPSILHGHVLPRSKQCGILHSSGACPLDYAKRRWWSAARVSSPEQNLQKYCKLKKFLWLFRWVFLKYLCSKVLILILSKSNDTEVYILNNNCYANAISLWFLYKNMGCAGGFSMGNSNWFFLGSLIIFSICFHQKHLSTSRSYQP